MTNSLNRSFKLVWSDLQQGWVAVSELTRTRGKTARGPRTGITGLALLVAILPMSANAVSSLEQSASTTISGITIRDARVDIGADGQAIDTVVDPNTFLPAYKGGQALRAVIRAGETMTVYKGDPVVGITIEENGTLSMTKGGTALDVIQSSGAIIYFSTDSNVFGVNSLGKFSIDASTHTANSVLVEKGSLVASVGSANDTTILKEGKLYVWVNGTANRSTVGGEIWLAEGGTAVQTHVTESGRMLLMDGAVARYTDVDGLLDVYDGKLVDTTISTKGGISFRSGGAILLEGKTLISGNVYGNALYPNPKLINNGDLIFSYADGRGLGADITGTGSLTLAGGGGLTISGLLTYTGPTIINDGSWLSLIGKDTSLKGKVTGQQGSRLSLDSGAQLTGKVDTVSLDVMYSGSRWTMTDDSTVDQLRLSSGVVDFQAPTTASFIPKTLTMKSLQGDGAAVIVLNAVLGNSSSASDKLVIDGGRASGATQLAIRNAGGLGDATTGNGINVVKTLNGAVTDPGAFFLARPVLAGAYEYSLNQIGQDWYLSSFNKAGRQSYRAETSLDSAMPSLGLQYGNVLLDSLRDRLNGSREGVNADSRLAWGRVIGVHAEHDGAAGGTDDASPRFKSNISAIQAGVNVTQHNSGDYSDLAGVYFALGQNNGQVDHQDGGRAGSVNLDGYSLGGYWTRSWNNGWTLDGAIQAGWNKIKSNSVNDLHFKTDGWSWGGSLEAFRSYSYGDGFSLEPQFQLTYQHLNLKSGNDSLAEIGFEDADSLQGRLGLRLAKNLDTRSFMLWAQPSLVHEFMADPTTHFSTPTQGDVNFHSDLSGTRIRLDVGVDGQINRDTDFSVSLNYQSSVSGNDASGYSGKVMLKTRF
ncbi:autotransporter outer membrane beta-barrel domain-containing protein [Chitinilyticum aquatile]|uniref:autotransporter outer membrane beta-barrel domain-containing protein n=1 Tax=Chitinilyticum aquatile TaxID=362520 RepID=UPI00138ACC65|nr:autotransporter outer membrane beta-barrel domain-containing protein [Chitinilyticum aquatile]